MTVLRRLKVDWSGTPVVGASVSTFYSASPDPTGFPSAVRAFFAALGGLAFPPLTITVPNTGDLINVQTGMLEGTWTDGTAPAPFSGTNSGDYAKGVGGQIRWVTGSVVAGRRLEGSTFLVPFAGGIFDTDGTLDTTMVTALKGAGDALIASPSMLSIWARPLPARPKKNGGTLPARTGESHMVMSCKVPDRVSWLKSRRR